VSGYTYNSVRGINFICSEDEIEDILQVRTKIYTIFRQIRSQTQLFAKDLEAINNAILILTLVFVMWEGFTADGSIFRIS
jgi:hypothetical protein